MPAVEFYHAKQRRIYELLSPALQLRSCMERILKFEDSQRGLQQIFPVGYEYSRLKTFTVGLQRNLRTTHLLSVVFKVCTKEESEL